MSRGRRPGAVDTRGAVLAAARSSFATKGFRGTTIRAVAAEAQVDPALVHHYFGTKDDLFLAALEFPMDPRLLVPEILGGGLDDAGARLLTAVLTVWDEPASRLQLLALFRTALASEEGPRLLEDGFLRLVLGPIREALASPDADVRVDLLASQVMGLLMTRYVLALEPLASLPRDEVVALVAPSVQRYLTGDLARGHASGMSSGGPA